jgi:hypothetical protein
MAALPVIPSVYRVALVWAGPGGLSAANVMHFLNEAGTTGGLHAALLANFTANMWHAIGSSSAITRIDILPLDGISATSSTTEAVAANLHGSATGDILTSDTILVKLTTGLRGRDKRGRVFLPFPGEVNTVNGALAGGEVTTMNTAWATWRSAMLSSGYELVVASYRYAAATPVGSTNVEAALGTQRRRQSRYRKSAGY